MKILQARDLIHRATVAQQILFPKSQALEDSDFDFELRSAEERLMTELPAEATLNLSRLLEC